MDGGSPLSTGCLNELSIMGGDCKSSSKGLLQRRPHCLHKIHREAAYKENDREGSFPLRHREGNRGSYQGREEREGVTVCESKKEREKHK